MPIQVAAVKFAILLLVFNVLHATGAPPGEPGSPRSDRHSPRGPDQPLVAEGGQDAQGSAAAQRASILREAPASPADHSPLNLSLKTRLEWAKELREIQMLPNSKQKRRLLSAHFSSGVRSAQIVSARRKASEEVQKARWQHVSDGFPKTLKEIPRVDEAVEMALKDRRKTVPAMSMAVSRWSINRQIVLSRMTDRPQPHWGLVSQKIKDWYKEDQATKGWEPMSKVEEDKLGLPSQHELEQAMVHEPRKPTPKMAAVGTQVFHPLVHLRV